MIIKKPDVTDIAHIIDIAKITWQETYKSIISQEQIDYMLKLFYDPQLIAGQMKSNSHFFWAAYDVTELLGYAHCIYEKQLFKLSKLYVHPKAQGKKVGASLLQAIEAHCLEHGVNTVTLNVNRHNPAKFFYEKQGFIITESVDIPLDKYWLNDYIMVKKIKPTSN